MFEKDDASAECPNCRVEAQALADKQGIPAEKAYDAVWHLAHRWAGI
jgi:hypothetical protein